jgi:hypothetical protein
MFEGKKKEMLGFFEEVKKLTSASGALGAAADKIGSFF